MRVEFKVRGSLLTQMRKDLQRPHAFAFERVGFISCGIANIAPDGLIILASEYHPVADEDYEDDRSVGAMMGSAAIRKALQFAYRNEVGMFHVHMHCHEGRPSPSRTDLEETAKFVPSFWHVRPRLAHGAIILSRDSISGRCWSPGMKGPLPLTKIAIVGPRMISIWA
jgi:hypothetical protein